MKSFFLIMIFIIPFAIKAQEIKVGFKMGANYARWDGDERTAPSAIVGLHVGPYLEIPINQSLALTPGLFYSTKGVQYKETFNINDENLGNVFIKKDDKYNVAYLDLPILLRIKIVRGLYASAGPQFSYLLNGNYLGKSLLNYGERKLEAENESDDISGYNKLDLALVAGLGYFFKNGINLNFGYDFGVYTIRDEGPQAFNRVFKVSLGYTL